VTAAPGGAAPLVLVVEDNPANLMLVEAVLRRAGYRVTSAVSVEEAIAKLETLRAEPPALLLTDVQLPGRDGFELVRHVRADSTFAQMVVVALTAFAMAEDRTRALAAGCDGYLAKPINTRTLAADLSTIVQGVRRTQKEGVGRPARCRIPATC
jgi:CheY-like chemotaxis protein